ncbi:MAG: hypothetical protein JNN00_01330 [Chitinophagaceae bacterium]|nr:hypothetical protein [Chitinophagaceae bacterium]
MTKKDTSRTTILVISMGFLVMYLVFGWKWAVYVSLATGITGATSAYLSQKIEWAWMQLARVLSYIVPNILLSLIFFLILFPAALINRLFTKDPLMLSGKYKTYFIDVNRKMDKKAFEKTW